MEEKISDIPKGFKFNGNPWEAKTRHRNDIIRLLLSDPERNFTATEIARKVDCTLQTAQIILLEMALEDRVHVQVTREGYGKLFRIKLSQVAEDVTQTKPKMSFDYRKEE